MPENIPPSEVSDIIFGKTFHTNTILELNSWIFVYEDDTWAVKGRYEDVLEDDEDAMWTCDSGQDILRLLIVSIPFFSNNFSNITLY